MGNNRNDLDAITIHIAGGIVNKWGGWPNGKALDFGEGD